MSTSPAAWHPDPHNPAQFRYWDGTGWTDHYAPRVAAAPAPAAPTGPLLQVMSHEDGRNAVVRLWPDRIEREKPKKRGAVSRASQETETVPISRVHSVTTRKEGRWTVVTVHAGQPVDFKLSHDVAATFRDSVMGLILG